MKQLMAGLFLSLIFAGGVAQASISGSQQQSGKPSRSCAGPPW